MKNKRDRHGYSGFKRPLLCIALALFYGGCSFSSLKFKKRNVKKGSIEYSVVNASQDIRPSWLQYPQGASSELAANEESHFYFSFESGPKISQEIACNIVRVYARDDLARRIVDFYLSTEEEGELELNWRLVLASEGLGIFKKNLKNSKILATYWERRLYAPKIGDTEEIEGFSCGLWIEVPKALFVESLEDVARLGKKRFWKVNGWDLAVRKWERDYRRFHEETY